MLTHLEIQNYALMEHLDLDFGPGLNIITGETGAGKSILLGAIGLILGQRASKSVLYQKDKKCIVEGLFKVNPESFPGFFENNDLDFDNDEIVLRRELTPSGKSRAFINDTPVRLDTLNILSSKLVDLHQQFETLDIQSTGAQYSALDAYCGNNQEVSTFRSMFEAYGQLQKSIAEKQERYVKAMREQDYLQFQIEEFEQVDLQPGEMQTLEEEYAMLSQAEEIVQTLSETLAILTHADQSIFNQIRGLIQQLNRFDNVATLEKMIERLESTAIEIDDLARDLEDYSQQVTRDPAALERTVKRMEEINRLQLKYQVRDEDALLEVMDQISQKMTNLSAMEEEIQTLQLEEAQLVLKMEKQAEKLAKARAQGIPAFKKEIEASLARLKMPNARIAIQCDHASDFNRYGKNDLSYSFSANKGQAPRPIREVASGGELSRLSLCIKSIVAGRVDLPTLIFDEIDSGVSGDVALKMGQMLKALGQHHQIIMVTHSAQIAARSTKHFKAFKREASNRTFTGLRPLNSEERITEIASMLSGDPPTPAALKNAKDLIEA